ncbi:MAG TPA: RecX family transcriptional regulator [Ktedonobacterales bacterium]|nr:RecX family transcriptional regulator [Ktedonobacterales bacterium]
MRITALDPQAHQPDRWNLHIDGAFAFALDGAVVVREGLYVGRELTDDELEQLRAVAQEQDLYAAALHFLAPRPRSRAEVRRRLLRPRPRHDPPSAAAVERVLEQLERAGYVNDGDFAAFWVENRERFSPRSARALGVELRQRGIARETVEAATAPELDDERALAAGRARLRSFRGLDYKSFRERMGAFLLRRGFSYGVAGPVVRQLWAESSGDRPAEADADDTE